MKRFFTAFAISAAVLAGAVAARADDLKVALIHGRTGPLEAYAKQTERDHKALLKALKNGRLPSSGGAS